MDGHEGRDIADGGQHLLTGGHGDGYPVLAGNLCNSSMVVVDGDNFHPRGCFTEIVDRVGSDRMGETDMQVVAPFLDEKLRFPGNKFHGSERGVCQVEVWMADHRRQCFIHIKEKVHPMGIGIV